MHLRGTAAPTMYSCTNEVQLHLRGVDASTGYSCTSDVQLHLGTAIPTGTVTEVEQHMKQSYAYEVKLRLRGKATPSGYSYAGEI
jgi:hypothetical protein